mgnify:CR=1 FL=1
MKDIAAHELPILVPDSGPLSGVSPTGPTASTSGLYVFNVGVVEHRAIPNLKPDDLVVFSLEDLLIMAFLEEEESSKKGKKKKKKKKKARA